MPKLQKQQLNTYPPKGIAVTKYLLKKNWRDYRMVITPQEILFVIYTDTPTVKIHNINKKTFLQEIRALLEKHHS